MSREIESGALLRDCCDDACGKVGAGTLPLGCGAAAVMIGEDDAVDRRRVEPSKVAGIEPSVSAGAVGCGLDGW
jgi:hypothetical protein